MSERGTALARLRKTVRRHARAGWQRAVFARPGDDATPEVIEGPGSAATETEIEALVAAAEAAARDGRVKQTLVLDARTRVRIDARWGKAKLQRLDDERVAKVMGGKERALRPDTSGDLLRAIGIMNPDGSIAARHAKKYKQVAHLVELCRPTIERIQAHRSIDDANPLRVLDLACGNSYLTFVLAETLRLQGIPAQMIGIDLRADVIERSRERARVLGLSHVSFQVAAIRDAMQLGDPPDLVVALHACDTATDEALALAIERGATAILCAPCCHAELARRLGRAPAPAILEHGLLGREYAAVLTDAIRVEVLDACEYAVDVVEFVDAGHTPKNLLLRAHRRRPSVAHDPARWALDGVRARCAAFGGGPALLDLLGRSGSRDALGSRLTEPRSHADQLACGVDSPAPDPTKS